MRNNKEPLACNAAGFLSEIYELAVATITWFLMVRAEVRVKCGHKSGSNGIRIAYPRGQTATTNPSHQEKKT